jgi:hypothetical protein
MLKKIAVAGCVIAGIAALQGDRLTLRAVESDAHTVSTIDVPGSAAAFSFATPRQFQEGVSSCHRARKPEEPVKSGIVKRWSKTIASLLPIARSAWT